MIQVLIATATLASFWIGFIVLKKDYRNKLNLSFAIFSFTISIWSLINFISDFSDHDLLIKLTFGIGAFLPPLSTLWISYFIQVSKLTKFRKFILLVYFLLSILFLLLSIFTETIASGSVTEVVFGSLFLFYTAFLLSAIFVPIYLMVRFYIRVSGLLRLQALYIILGLGFFGSSTLLVSFALPLFGLQEFGRLDSISSLFFVGFSAYAIIKHRLMDIRFIIRKFVFYFGLGIFIFIAYYIVAWVDENIFGGQYTIGAVLSAFVMAPLFLMGFFYTSRMLKRVATKYFFTSLYDYQETLDNFARKISRTIHLKEVIYLFIDTIQDTMHVDNLAVFNKADGKNPVFKTVKIMGFNDSEITNFIQKSPILYYLNTRKQPITLEDLDRLALEIPKEAQKLKGIKEEYKKQSISLCLPLISKAEILSIILLGPKISKDAYTNEDLKLLGSLGNQAAVSMENAQLYQRVQDFNKILQEKVGEQTKDIKDKNVRLQELLKMKSDFLTVASHQLRTPTSIVRGMLSLVCEEEGLPNEEREKFIHQAYEGINRLERIIHDLLNATELEGKKMHLDFEKTQVEEVVKEVYSGLMPLAKEKKLNLILDVPKKPLPKITLDPLKLKEAVANLIDNAIHYTPSGEVKVSVAKDGDKIKIVVKDTGIGMSKTDQKNLFKKFVRGEGILQIHPNGSGLGLFIARRMLEAMSGTIEAFSEGKGKGSVFTIGLKIR